MSGDQGESNETPVVARNIARPSNQPSANTVKPEEAGVRSSRGNNTNILLFSVVALFLACHIFRFFGLYYHEQLTIYDDVCVELYINGSRICNNTGGNGTMKVSSTDMIRILEYPQWLWYINPLGAFLLRMNSALNFIIYVLAGTRFRKTFLRKLDRIFCRYRQQHPDPNNTIDGTNNYPLNRLETVGSRGNS